MNKKIQQTSHCAWPNGFASTEEPKWFVYVIAEVPFHGDAQHELVKIGSTMRPPCWRSGANLKRGNPRELWIAEVFSFPDEIAMIEAECGAHSYFSGRQKFNGHELKREWFNVSVVEAATYLVGKGGRKVCCACDPRLGAATPKQSQMDAIPPPTD